MLIKNPQNSRGQHHPMNTAAIVLFFLFMNGFSIGKCAKLLDSQTMNLLVNEDDLMKPVFKEVDNDYKVKGGPTELPTTTADYNLYRSELNRLSYETIHRILRDEDVPIYRRRQPPSNLNYYSKTALASFQQKQQQQQQHHLRNPLEQIQPAGEHLISSRRHKRSMPTEGLINKDYNKLSLVRHNLTNSQFVQIAQKHIHLISDLDLSENLMTWLPIEDLRQLLNLNLAYNQFNSIPLLENSTIITLNLNYNRIKSTVIPFNSQLKELFLSANQIENLTDLQFSHLPNLEILDLSCNRLKSLEATFFNQLMYNLKHLNLAFNNLNIIYRQTFYNLFSLNTLLLAGNNISDIDYETFLSLPNLQYLDLSHNRLQGKSIRALQGITGLVVLSITYNWHLGPYMQEFVASWSLKELDASGTGLCQIPAALAQSVRSLKLTHNSLKMINCGDLDSYPLLHYLDLSYNHIQEIEDDALGRLEMLEILMLDHNDLHKVPMSLPTSLEHLFLHHNQIMDLQASSFQDLNNLQTLDLAGNKLLYLPALPLGKLQTLNLQAAGIRSINQAIVHTLPLLNDLLLEDNPIKCSDLMGIAEWASNCRLTIKDEHYATDENEQSEMKAVAATTTTVMNTTALIATSPPSASAHIDLKTKFLKMHNFYENFPSNLCQQQQQQQQQRTEIQMDGENFRCITENNMNRNPVTDETYLLAATKNPSLITTTATTTEVVVVSSKDEEKQPAIINKEILGTLNLHFTNGNSSKMMKRGEYILSPQTQHITTLSQVNPIGLLLKNATSIKENITKDTKIDNLPKNQINQLQQQQQQEIVSASTTASTEPSPENISTASLDYTMETLNKSENIQIPQIRSSKIEENSRPTSDQQGIVELHHVGRVTARNMLQLQAATTMSSPWTGVSEISNNRSMALTPQAINSFKVRFEQMKPLNPSRATSSATTIDTNAPPLNTTSDRDTVNSNDGNNNSNNNNNNSNNKNNEKGNKKFNSKPIHSNNNDNIDHNSSNGNNDSNDRDGSIGNRSVKPQFQFNIANYNNNNNNNNNIYNKQNGNQNESQIANIEAIEQHRSPAYNYTAGNHSVVHQADVEECQLIATGDNHNSNSQTKSMSVCKGSNNGNQVIVTSHEYMAINSTAAQTTTTTPIPSNSKDNTTRNSISSKDKKYTTETTNIVKCVASNYNECNRDVGEEDEQRQQQDPINEGNENNRGLYSKLSKKTAAIRTTTRATENSKPHVLAELHVQNRHLVGAPLLIHNLHHQHQQYAAKMTNNKQKHLLHLKETQRFGKTNLYTKDNRSDAATSDDDIVVDTVFDGNSTNTANYKRKQKTFQQEQKQNYARNTESQEIDKDLEEKSSPPPPSLTSSQHTSLAINKESKKEEQQPSLIMRKMTIITGPHNKETIQTVSTGPQLQLQLQLSAEQEQHALLADDVNEYPTNYYHNTLNDDFESFALEPANNKNNNKTIGGGGGGSVATSGSRHSTINTPIKRDINTTQLVKLEQMQARAMPTIQKQTTAFNVSSKTEHWSDMRSTHNFGQQYQSLLMLVIAGTMVLLLIIGLIHVYRCRLPWLRLGSMTSSRHPHRRPHREHHHNNCRLTDDSHSFLRCHENRYNCNYLPNCNSNSSSLQNLHLPHNTQASLQKYFPTSRQLFNDGHGGGRHHHACCSNDDHQQQSQQQYTNNSNTTTINDSTTTLNSSTITVTDSPTTHQTTNDDESLTFYIEMQTDSRQLNSLNHLHGELLPMELLNVNVKETKKNNKCYNNSRDDIMPPSATVFRTATREPSPAFSKELQTSSRRFTQW